MTEVEIDTSLCIKIILGNQISRNYPEIVNMFKSFHKLAANISVKIDFLHRCLDKFPSNLDYSKEQGERFHQDIRIME